MPQTDLLCPASRPVEGFYTTEVEALDRRPVHTFLPFGYEPNYAYPLLVFFHGHGGDEEEVLRLAPRVSRRNYICIGLRGPQNLGIQPDGRVGFSWGAQGGCDADIEDYLFQAIDQTRRAYHIHSERVYLAGFCEGSAAAFSLGLRYPSRFAGVVSMNGSLPRTGCPLLRLSELRNLRVFLGHGIANPVAPLPSVRNDYRLLYTAGLPVTLHTYPTTHRIHSDMLRDLNRWVMRHVNGEE